MGKSKKVTLLCGKDDCCPTVTFQKNSIVIADDLGGKTTFTNEQFAVLKEKIKKGDI